MDLSKMDFSKEELQRYNRHIILSEIGISGQEKMKSAKVLVVGAGGLGAPLLQYLAAAGIGTIGIVDFDVVEDSNLQRQVLFTQKDIGRPKVEAAKDRLLAQNPHININIYNTSLTRDNALEIAKGYDLIADGTDNFPTRYLVNDVSVLLDIPNVYGSIFKFEGQVSVFNYKGADGRNGPNYRDLFPVPPAAGSVPSCSEAGVLGVLPGIIGSLQATEVIKVITGVGSVLSSKLFFFDAAKFESRTLKIEKNLDAEKITELIDYEAFCGVADESESNKDELKSISVETLKSWLDSHENIQLIDVREPHEYEIANINGKLIPQNDVQSRLDEISRDVKVVIHCRSGKRSAGVIKALQHKHGFQNLYNLEGGILDWAEKIDKAMVKY